MAVHCMKYGKSLHVVGTGGSCGLVDLFASTTLRSSTCSTPLVSDCEVFHLQILNAQVFLVDFSVVGRRLKVVLLNMSDSLSFDWRNFQPCLAISAIMWCGG